MNKNRRFQVMILPTNDQTNLVIDNASSSLRYVDTPSEVENGFQLIYILTDQAELSDDDLCDGNTIECLGRIGLYHYNSDNNTHDLIVIQSDLTPITYPYSSKKNFNKVITSSDASL